MKYIFVLILFIPSILKAQDINIPDSIFLDFLLNEQKVDTNGDGKVQVSEVNTLKHLDLGNDFNTPKIKNLEGIQYFTALTRLDCYDQDLDTLDLRALKNLRICDVRASKLTSLRVAGLDKLQHLYAHNNKLTSLDVTGLTSLTYLYVYHNNISSIDLSDLKKLDRLQIYSCNLSTLDVSELPKLTDIRCYSNNLTEIKIATENSIKYLGCSYNQLTNIDLSVLTSMQYLHCIDNPISKFEFPDDNVIKNLYIGHLPIESLDLTKLSKLEISFVENNKLLKSLDVTSLNNLKKLYIKNNPQLEEVVGLSTLSSIGELDYYQTPLYNFELPESLYFLHTNDCIPYLPDSLYAIYVPDTTLCLPNKPRWAFEDNPDINRFFGETRIINREDSKQISLPICGLENNIYGCQPYPSISGNIFVDSDLDNVLDEKEVGFDGVKLTVLSQDKSFYTDANGNYFHAFRDTGEYSIFIDEIDYFDVTPQNVDLKFSNFSDRKTQEIALQPTEIANDLKVEIVNFDRARPGFPMRYYIDYHNVGTTDIEEAEVLFEMPSEFILDDTTSIPSQNGNTLTYNVGKLISGKGGRILVAGRTIIETELGKEQIPEVSILDLSLEADKNSLNNFDTVQYEITGSFDPNDIAGPEYISPEDVANQTLLDYRIRFQNTGTDTAFNVVVTDTIVDNLDLSTLQINSSSHAMTSRVEGNVLIFEFKDILLPDSIVNEPESHGFIYYSIAPESTLELGEEITNKASIYFDYNKPIITNTAITTVYEVPDVVNSINQLTNTEETLFYPNPINGLNILYLKDKTIDAIKIIDLSGKIVFSQEFIHHKVSLPELKTGLYLIELTGNNMRHTEQLVVK